MPIRPEFRAFYRGPAWQALRARISKRAGNACERCGIPNGVRLLVPPRGRLAARLILIQCGCAHLDHDPRNNADDNLAWLCRGCHLRHDVQKHRETRSIRKDRARPLLAALIGPSVTPACAAGSRTRPAG